MAIEPDLRSARPPEIADGAASLKSRPGLARLFPALRYALQGLSAAWRHEASFRQEVAVGLVAFLASFWIAPTLTMWLAMTASILLVWCLELVNSAIEALADTVSMERHPLLGRAKDLGSAAVLMALCIATAVWAIALYLRFVA